MGYQPTTSRVRRSRLAWKPEAVAVQCKQRCYEKPSRERKVSTKIFFRSSVRVCVCVYAHVSTCKCVGVWGVGVGVWGVGVGLWVWVWVCGMWVWVCGVWGVGVFTCVSRHHTCNSCTFKFRLVSQAFPKLSNHLKAVLMKDLCAICQILVWNLHMSEIGRRFDLPRKLGTEIPEVGIQPIHRVAHQHNHLDAGNDIRYDPWNNTHVAVSSNR